MEAWQGVKARSRKKTEIILTFGHFLSAFAQATPVLPCGPQCLQLLLFPTLPFSWDLVGGWPRSPNAIETSKSESQASQCFHAEPEACMAFTVPGKQGDFGSIIFLLKAPGINAEEREGSVVQRKRGIRCYISFLLEWLAYLVSTKKSS